MEWFESDMKKANANRDKVPWVVGFAHSERSNHAPPPFFTSRYELQPSPCFACTSLARDTEPPASDLIWLVMVAALQRAGTCSQE